MRRKILEINNMCGEEVPESLLEIAVHTTLSEEKIRKNPQVSLALVSPKMMRELNLKYKGRDSLTDVLAFPLQEEMGPAKKVLGEIIICPHVAKIQAKQRGHSLQEELLLLTIHGTLHLLGYTDEKDNRRGEMEDKQRRILKLLGTNGVRS